MFKYEQEIMECNIEYRKYYQDDEWRRFARVLAFDAISINTKVAIKKYYSLVEGEGYVRVKEAKGCCCFGIDRSDRDQFEQNDIKYPREGGLYLIGQTFFNPITDEKYYWIKVGEASDLKRRRREYNTTTAMIWDIGYYTGNDLTESGCHEKLKEICLHRHADEWFSIPREDYLKICEIGFDWFKEA